MWWSEGVIRCVLHLSVRWYQFSSWLSSAHYHNPVFISTSVEAGSGDCPVQSECTLTVQTTPPLWWCTRYCTVQWLPTGGHPVFVSAAQYHLAVVYSNQRVINVCEAKNVFFQQNILIFPCSEDIPGHSNQTVLHIAENDLSNCHEDWTMLWVGPPVTFSLNFLLLCSFHFSGVQSDLPGEHDQESLVSADWSQEVRRIFLVLIVIMWPHCLGISGQSSEGAG